MCTQARLVQASRTSDWFGMSHGTGPQPNVILEAGTPAYLEVSVDPAAHGEAGLGKIHRMVWMETESGQELQFNLTAYVTP
jgi:hypothetical protein